MRTLAALMLQSEKTALSQSSARETEKTDGSHEERVGRGEEGLLVTYLALWRPDVGGGADDRNSEVGEIGNLIQAKRSVGRAYRRLRAAWRRPTRSRTGSPLWPWPKISSKPNEVLIDFQAHVSKV
ncbi:hypothetical protein KC19_11G157100 [Ceratodon purpureus]|uniref:Uncharacterized protein n=1 Tax=Ceratodon purpureus TaxID=3225 RepID=A0A8T0GFJ7_CERPU|nr:hypothetical protein KC19_11G157100 [Ceratodon purpureus]